MDRFLLRIQQRGWGWPFAILTIVVTCGVWWSVYQAMDRHPAFHGQSVLLFIHPALLVTSIVAHELGHWLMFRRLGFRPMLFTVIFGGATYVADEDWQRLRPQLSFGQEASIHLGGVLANLALLAMASLATSDTALRPAAVPLCYLNGCIIATNLLPIRGLDGARFFDCFRKRPTLTFERFRDRVWGAVYLGLMAAAFAGIYAIRL